MKLYTPFMESNDYTIFQDLDGCLADFDGGFKKLSGYTPDEFKAKYEAEGKKYTADFWKIIHSTPVNFFSNLEFWDDGKKLWNYIKKYNPIILTGVPSFRKGIDINDSPAAVAKKEWVRKNLGEDIEVIPVISSTNNPFKEKYATSEKSMLIDDQLKNIDKWRTAGGTGIHFTTADKAISELKELGL